jgi:hypothetical protein
MMSGETPSRVLAKRYIRVWAAELGKCLSDSPLTDFDVANTHGRARKPNPVLPPTPKDGHGCRAYKPKTKPSLSL